MASDTVISRPGFAWGVAARALPGQAISGDLHLVKPVDEGVLLAAVDGLGHGEEATAAARIALSILERHAGDSIVSLVQRCHVALARTRGVVMTLALLDLLTETLTWLGVGNVEALLLRADPAARPVGVRPILRNGVVGFLVPELRAESVPIASGDQVVFVTDGIRAGFAQGWQPSEGPQQVADRILERYFKGNDDALVLVAQYVRGADE